MELEDFSLRDRSEIEKFEEFLYQYETARTQFALKHISLVTTYDNLQGREDGGRIFAALLDIQLSFVLLRCDLLAIGGIWNENFSKGKLEGGSILDSQAKFFGKMDIYRFSTSYVLRYRALWDKIMGILVLAFSPSDYEGFVDAKSKKKTFRKIATKTGNIPELFVKDLEELLTNFDDKFRTAEAHGTGILRKYSFSMESMDKNPQIELIGYWNSLNDFIITIGGIFRKAEQG